MTRHFAKLICLVIGGAAGWYVLIELASIFSGWIPPAAGAAVMTFVFSMFYFPLARPIADIIADRLTVAAHRGRHIRVGSGLDDIPEAEKQPTCSICGDPNGPICPACNEKMLSNRKPNT